MKCVIVYCRVSSTQQAEDGVSLAMQQERASNWAAAMGYSIEAVFIETMSAGKAANRVQLQLALDLTCKRKGLLLIYSLSRLARNLKDALEITERLERAGADFASITEKIDTSSPIGKMVFRILACLGEFERDQLRSRVSGAMSHMRRGNKRISNHLPLGYDLGADGSTLIPNQREQEALQLVHRLRNAGMSLSGIARELTKQQVRTKYSSQWYASTVRGILNRSGKMAA